MTAARRTSLARLINRMAEDLFAGKASPEKYLETVRDSVTADSFAMMKLLPGEAKLQLLSGLNLKVITDDVEAPLILEEAVAFPERSVVSPTGSFVCDPFLNSEGVRAFLLSRGSLGSGHLLTLAMRRSKKSFSANEIERFASVTNYINLVFGFLDMTSDLKKHRDHDTLTGFLNYNPFHDTLKKEVSRARRHKRSLCLGMISVEGLADFWSSCGQITTENIILKISRSIKENIRDFDITARYSPWEFSLILPELNITDGIHTAERILAGLNDIASEFSGDGELAFRIGMANYPDDTTTTERLLEIAEAALAKARESGSDSVVRWEE